MKMVRTLLVIILMLPTLVACDTQTENNMNIIGNDMNYSAQNISDNSNESLVFSGGVNDWKAKIEFIKNNSNETCYAFTVIYSGNLEELKKYEEIHTSFIGKYNAGIELTGNDITTGKFYLTGSGSYPVNSDDLFSFLVQTGRDEIEFPLDTFEREW